MKKLDIPTEIQIPEHVLRKMYIEDKLSTVQIAKILHCGETTVCDRLKRYNIPARTTREAMKVWREQREKMQKV